MVNGMNSSSNFKEGQEALALLREQYVDRDGVFGTEDEKSSDDEMQYIINPKEENAKEDDDDEDDDDEDDEVEDEDEEDDEDDDTEDDADAKDENYQPYDNDEEEEDDDEEDDDQAKGHTDEDDQGIQDGTYVQATTSGSSRKTNRIVRKCPLCKKNEKYLSTHLSRKHGITEKEKRMKILYVARDVTPIRWLSKENTKSARRKPMRCTICGATNLQRLDIHLAKAHNVAKGAEMREATRKIRKKIDGKTTDDVDIFSRYQKHLQMIGRKLVTAKEYRRILKKTISKYGSFVELFEVRDVFERFCKDTIDEHAPDTARKYIRCIKLLTKWCLQDYRALEDTGVRKKAMKRIRCLTKTYGQGLLPAIQEHRAQKKDAIQDVIFSTEEIQETDTALLKPALQIIEKLQTGDKVSSKDIFLLRDFLIVRLLFRSGQRAGVITNVTMADYRKGTTDIIQDNHVIRVKDHKTKNKFGDANLVCDSVLWRWLSVYVIKGRPLNPRYTLSLENDDSPLFLSGVGGSLTKVGQTLKRRADQLGLEDPRKILPTNIRKSVVTRAHEELSPRERERLAGYMCHSVETAQGYYKARQKAVTNVLASYDIANLMGLGEGTSQGQSIVPPSNVESLEAVQLNRCEQYVGEETSQARISPSIGESLNADQTNCPEQHSLSDYEEQSTDTSSKKKIMPKRLLSDEQEEEMMKLVDRAVLANSTKKKKVTLRRLTDAVYDRMSKSGLLSLDKKQFYDKARHARKARDKNSKY